MGHAEIFVGDLSYFCTEHDLRDRFQLFGPITNVIIKRNYLGKSLLYGFIHYQQTTSAQQAVSTMNGQKFMGRTIIVHDTSSKAPKKNYTSWHKVNVYFATFAHINITESFLHETFNMFGEIADIVIREHNQHSTAIVSNSSCASTLTTDSDDDHQSSSNRAITEKIQWLTGYGVIFYQQASSAIHAVEYMDNRTSLTGINFTCTFRGRVAPQHHQHPSHTTTGTTTHSKTHEDEHDHLQDMSLIQRRIVALAESIFPDPIRETLVSILTNTSDASAHHPHPQHNHHTVTPSAPMASKPLISAATFPLAFYSSHSVVPSLPPSSSPSPPSSAGRDGVSRISSSSVPSVVEVSMRDILLRSLVNEKVNYPIPTDVYPPSPPTKHSNKLSYAPTRLSPPAEKNNAEEAFVADSVMSFPIIQKDPVSSSHQGYQYHSAAAVDFPVASNRGNVQLHGIDNRAQQVPSNPNYLPSSEHHHAQYDMRRVQNPHSNTSQRVTAKSDLNVPASEMARFRQQQKVTCNSVHSTQYANHNVDPHRSSSPSLSLLSLVQQQQQHSPYDPKQFGNEPLASRYSHDQRHGYASTFSNPSSSQTFAQNESSSTFSSSNIPLMNAQYYSYEHRMSISAPANNSSSLTSDRSNLSYHRPHLSQPSSYPSTHFAYESMFERELREGRTSLHSPFPLQSQQRFDAETTRLTQQRNPILGSARDYAANNFHPSAVPAATFTDEIIHHPYVNSNDYRYSNGDISGRSNYSNTAPQQRNSISTTPNVTFLPPPSARKSAFPYK